RRRDDRLDKRRVTSRRQRPLAPQAAYLAHPLVTEVEEHDQCPPGERPHRGLTLELGQMRDRVLLEQDLHRPQPELALADRDPRIPLIGHVIHEPAQRALITAKRRDRPPLRWRA